MRDYPLHAYGPMRGHPRGLTVTILTGMWENFALFGMRTILVFYLVKELQFRESDAIRVYSLSTSAGLVMTILGGVLADRLLGLRRSVVFGASAMAVGHLMLIVPSLLYAGLFLITIGYGFFKPALVSQVSQLYALDDPRRDRAFTLYKAGANVGAIAAPIVCGAVGAAFGWGWALGVCGIGMCVSVVIYLAGARHLIAHPGSLREPAAVAADGGARSRIPLQLMLVLLSAILFWAAYNQIGGAVALWLDAKVDRWVDFGFGRFEVPAAWAQSLNPILIVALTPLINNRWARYTDNPGLREMLRMIGGAVMLAASFLLLWAGVESTSAGLVSPLWLLGSIVLLSLAELYFDPVGQAYALRYARPKMISTFASIWFLLQAAGLFLTGMVAAYWGVVPPAEYFLGVALIATVTAALLYAAKAAGSRRGSMQAPSQVHS